MHPARRARMLAHADSCPRCAALLAEYRAIDALLSAPRTLEPAPNFTFKVMAEIRPLPPPRAHRSPTFAILATYIAFGWVTIGSFLMFGGTYARAMLATLGIGFGQAGTIWKMLAGVTGRTFGSRAFDVTAAMGGLLAADFTVVALVLGVYAVRRSRWAASARRVDRADPSRDVARTHVFAALRPGCRNRVARRTTGERPSGSATHDRRRRRGAWNLDVVFGNVTCGDGAEIDGDVRTFFGRFEELDGCRVDGRITSAGDLEAVPWFGPPRPGRPSSRTSAS